ncbi:MAG: NADH:flavin oxidoreductase [Planctomycetes bacterium]|nr:NADH:flavin oxidoreductase [Planctomycetota bacterium]
MVRHPLPDESWPTAEAAATSRWFSSCALGAHRVADRRTWVPAMVPWRASADGFVTQDVLDWYARFARGKPGVLVVEATGIRDVPSGPLLRAGHDRFVPGLKQLADVVREQSHGATRLLVQLIDFLAIRRRPEPATFFARFLRIDDALRERVLATTGDPTLAAAPEDRLRAWFSTAPRDVIDRTLDAREREALDFGARERVTDTHVPHIRELPQVLPELFAAAAQRAEQAGFDGVELHYAHAYTMASFLSRTNDRADGYGGSLDGRLRLPLEVHAAVRARVAPSFVVGCRFLGDEVIEGGSRLDDAVAIGVAFARAGMDFLSISKGGKFDDAKQPKVGEAAYPYTGRSGHECMPTVTIDERGPFSRNVSLAAAIRAAVRAAGHTTPVVTAGGIATFSQAEGILARGEADFVAAARQSLADPDWFEKVRLGRGDAVLRCKFTNYCEALDQQHKQVTCQLWDRAFDPADAHLAKSPDGRRRLVAPEWSDRPRAP